VASAIIGRVVVRKKTKDVCEGGLWELKQAGIPH